MKKLTLLSALILSSCSTVVPVRLQVPPEPIYPKIQPTELQCLTDSAYSRLAKRDKMKTAHIKTLEKIIRSTH